MKNQFTALVVTVFIGSFAMAQSKSQTSVMNKTPKAISSQGVRVSLLGSILDADVKAKYQGTTFSMTEKLDQTLGLAVGYAYLPIQSLGWTSNVAYLDIKNQGSTTGMVRLDGNLGYAFTSNINIKGGVNLSKFTSGSNSENVNPGLGFQAGLGVQMTQNFGLDLGYTQMNQSGTTDGITVDIKESGLEIGLNGTF